MDKPSINVAIVGGGIAGLTLARGLVRQPQLRVTVYEATREFLDIGGGVAFHGNAMRALELIDPKLQEEYFARATLMSERDTELSTKVMVGDKIPDREAGEALLAELGKAKGRKTVARCDLLKGFFCLLPEGIVEFGKRLSKVEQVNDGIALTFKDGTTAMTDVLLSCDGVHSITRSYLLGSGHPAVEPKNHDNWAWIQRTVPAEEANALNQNLFGQVPIWCGHGAYVNSMPLHFGRNLSISVVVKGPKTVEIVANGDSTAEVSQTDYASGHIAIEQFQHWTKDVRDLVELTKRNPTTDWKLMDHDAAPFYARGRICLLGDAAHACMPFNGQGAAQAIEDAAVLSKLFEHISDISEVEAALQAYDAVRRPRSQRVVELSRQFGRMYAFAEENVGDDVDKIRKIMQAGALFTNNVDLQAQNEDALKRFRENSARTSEDMGL